MTDSSRIDGPDAWMGGSAVSDNKVDEVEEHPRGLGYIE
jgi:hypothetical protein